MSTEQSKTPICDRLYANYPVLDTQRGCRAILWIDAEKIELAANSLADALRPFAEPHGMGDNYVQFAPHLIVAAREKLAEFEKLKI